MSHDGSLASQMEAWIVTQIRGLTGFDAQNAVVYEGSMSPTGEKLIAELTSHRSPYVVVLFEGDQPRPLEEGAQAYEPTYGIYIVVQSKRPGVARKGDDETAGTNKLRDDLRTILHDQRPGLSAGGYYTDLTEFRGVRVVFERKDVFMLRAEVVVRESPAA